MKKLFSILKNKTKFNTNKISVKVTILIILITVCVLSITTVGVIMFTKSVVNKGVVGELKAIAEINSQEVQDILTTANIMNSYLEDYHNQSYEEMLKDSKNDAEKSLIYGVPLSESQYISEQYYINQISTLMKENTMFRGIGVYFEPYAFSNKIENYSIYMNRNNFDKKVYSEFSDTDDYRKEEWYSKTLEKNKQIITKVYNYKNMNIVSIAKPITYNGKIVGIVLADVRIDEFKKIKTTHQNYKTMYASVITNEAQYALHSIDSSVEGKYIDEKFSVEKERKSILDSMKEGNSFQIKATSPEGKKYMCFFEPVKLGEYTWWSQTALQYGDMMKDIYRLIIILVLGFLASIGVMIFMSSRAISKKLKPLEQLNESASALLQGSLDYEITYVSEDEIGVTCENMREGFKELKRIIEKISEWMNALGSKDFTLLPEMTFPGIFSNIEKSYASLLNSMNESFRTISSSTDTINGGAAQVSSAAQEIATGATEQAASIEELSATITNISEQVKVNAKNAIVASDSVKVAKRNIIQNNEQMHNLMKSMKNISNASTEIEKIIKTIDDIAFQTNILALNAAVEAARAGEAGKGFAVVADEVRNLAGKSAEAAKNTTELIESAINAIGSGMNIAQKTAQTLEQIVENTGTITETIEQIAVDSKEQSEEVDEITKAIEQISAVVQSNSALSEESVATSEELAAQSSMLDSVISKFRLQ